MTTTTAPPVTAHLTRIRIAPHSLDAARDLTDGQSLHRRVMGLVPVQYDEAPRAASGILHRLERDTNRHTLYIQSTDPLDLERLPAGYATSTDTRDLSRLLDWLAPGRPVRYLIHAQPMRATPNHELDTHGRRRRGTRTPLFGGAAVEWWLRKATEAGLAIDPDTLLHGRPGDVTGWKPATTPGSRRIHIEAKLTRFTGTGVVTDADALRAAVATGIGRGRPYGAGLLSLAPHTRE